MLKKIYKYIGLFAIMVFSFYYTDKIALMVQSNNPIMQKINDAAKENEKEYVNAIIDDENIIPGKNGLAVNAEKSFSIMKSFGTFNSYYLVYDQKKPEISLEDNKDKIINNGNLSSKNIALVLEYNQNTISYLEENNIKASVLVNKENYQSISRLEKINYDFNNYEPLETVLKKEQNANQLCFVNNRDYLSFCKGKGKYLVDTDLILTNDSIFSVKNQIKNGSIIFIKKDTSIDTIKVLLSHIKFKGQNPVYLSTLISEENS